MRLRWITIALLLSVVLSACATSATSPTAEATPQPSPVVVQVTPAGEESTAPAACTVVTRRGQATAASLFPAVTDEDWSKGPADARVTFLEYSDFM